MHVGQGYSTNTKRVFLCLFLLINITRMQQFANDIAYLKDLSGEFTSPGYPNTQSVYVGWNITVDEDHRILLQFLDFELVESNSCNRDVFELYDGTFSASSTITRWCWDSFDKLNPTTFISSDNIFLLRLRTLQGYSRKGFKANYRSIPKKVTTTNTLNVKQTTAPNEVLVIHTTSTRNTPRKSATTNILNMTPTTTVVGKVLGSTQSATQAGMIVAIVTSVIVAFIVTFIAALIVWKYKINNLPKVSSNHDPSKSLPRGNTSTEMYEVVKREKVHDIENNFENTERKEEQSIPATNISSNMQQLGVYSKEIVREGDLNTPDGTYETPDVKVYTYADPNEMKFSVTK